MKFPDKITEEQQKIIQATEGYIRVAAVPGSGKTLALTYRIAYLITELYVDPASIVALTFTNKAAGEMKQRLKDIIGDKCNCFAGTFHGYCNKILKEEIHRLSFPKTFSILDKKAELELIREVADEVHVSLKQSTARKMMEEIDRKKLDTAYIEWMTELDLSHLEQMIAQTDEAYQKVFYAYIKKERENYVLDFEDVIHFALYIFDHFPEARETWQDRCMYVLCDEFQDVSAEQYRLLTVLSGKYGNLFVVGDDDQNIYSWRGSNPEYMIHFHENYPEVKSYQLTENFRSTPQVVALSKSLIQQNRNRLEKEMFTNNQTGAKPVFNQLKTEKEESAWIANCIADGQAQGKLYSDYVVLVRASSQTRSLEEAFVRKKVPYKILSGAKFYEAEEIRTVLAYLRMIYSQTDLDFRYTIARPRRGFGKKSQEKLALYAKAHQCTMFQALGAALASGEITKEPVVQYYQEMQRLHENYGNYSSHELAKACLALGYRTELEQDFDQTKLDNVSELLDTIQTLEKENMEPVPLGDMLEHFALFTAQDEDTKHNVVRVMTIHTAKGLEFDTVFIPGLIENQFPSYRLKNEDEYEEERRLLYVAMTRAKKMLYLSSYKNKVEGYPARTSSLLCGIDTDCVACINGSRLPYGSVTEPMREKIQFKEGDIVWHKIFGKGRILKADTEAQVYEIQFEQLSAIRRIQFRAELRSVGWNDD